VHHAKREFLLEEMKECYEYRMLWLTIEELYKNYLGRDIYYAVKIMIPRPLVFHANLRIRRVRCGGVML